METESRTEMRKKMNFSDVIKKSVLQSFSYSDITTITILVTLFITFVLACYIFMIYRLVTKSAFYVKSFNVSMAIISVVTAGIILAMQSSIVISLGMVGALSIVRFRTAIKDPMDLLFLFWSIGTGIICGAGLFNVAVLLCILVTVGILVLDLFPVKKAPYLLIVNSSDGDLEESLLKIVEEMASHQKVKSRNLTKSGLDLIIELRTDRGPELVKKIGGLEAVNAVSLMAHDGEIRS